MMSSKPICSHSLQTIIYHIFFFYRSEFSNRVKNGGRTKKFDSPFIPCQLIKELIFSSENRLIQIHFSSWKFPFICIFILENQVNSVLSCIMKALNICAIGINERPLFGSSTICMGFTCLLIYYLVGRQIINIHCARIWYLVKNAFVQFRHFVKFIRELFCVAVKLFHQPLSFLHELNIIFSHPYENWGSLYHETNIDSHKVFCESVKHAWINIMIILKFCIFFSQFY